MLQKTKNLKLNALLNVIKQICSIVFPIITFPYASRILGSFYYGKINLSASIISYFSMVAALGINGYAIREGARVRNEKNKFQALVNEIFSINILSTIFSYILLLVIILFAKQANGYVILLLIQSLPILFTTLGADWINTVYEDYLYITVRYIICQVISLLLMFLLVRTRADYVLYAFVSVCSSVFANVANFFYIHKKYNIHPRFIVNMKIKKHLKPILIMFGSSIATQIYINSDVTIIGIFKGEAEVGIYSAAAKIYTMVKLVFNAMLVVAIPRITSYVAEQKNDQICEKLEELVNSLFILILPACAGLCCLSPNIISLASGEEYVGAAVSLRILSGALVFAIVACMYINVILVPYGKEKHALAATVISALLNIILNVLFIPVWGKEAAAITTLLSEIMMVILGYHFTKDLVKIRINKSVLVSVIDFIVVFFVCIFCLKFFESNIIQIISSIIISFILWIVVLAIADKNAFDKYISIVLNVLRKKER